MLLRFGELQLILYLTLRQGREIARISIHSISHVKSTKNIYTKGKTISTVKGPV